VRRRGELEIATLGSSSWMSCAPQGVKGLDEGQCKLNTNVFVLKIGQSLFGKNRNERG